MKRDLPRRVYRKHGAFYFVTLDNRWLRLSAERDGLPAMYRALAKLTEADAASDRMPGVIARWIKAQADKGKWAPKTQRDIERAGSIISAAFADFAPGDVTTPDCSDYLDRLAGKARTFNMHRTLLRSVLSFAALKGLREGYNPVDDVPRESTPGRRRIVTDAEVARLKIAARQQSRNGEALVQMIDLALLTGQRIGDLIRMRWPDVTEAGIFVEQGKTGERLLIEWTPALRKAIDACRRDDDELGFVLKTQSGRGYRYAGIRSAWVRACERAGIDDLHIHDLRGRAGVDALGDEEDVRAAQRLLGHKGERMTRHYIDGKYARKARPAR